MWGMEHLPAGPSASNGRVCPHACCLPSYVLTCSYVYINGALVGGCDATKALIASGEFDKMVGGEWKGGDVS